MGRLDPWFKFPPLLVLLVDLKSCNIAHESALSARQQPEESNWLIC